MAQAALPLAQAGQPPPPPPKHHPHLRGDEKIALWPQGGVPVRDQATPASGNDPPPSSRLQALSRV